MKLAFIGMSGTGKSYWTKEISNFLKAPLVSSDSFIREKLGAEVGPELGSDTLALSAWLGLPTSPLYAERAAKYLSWEQESIEHAIELSKSSNNLVLDTSGSVVHLEQPLLKSMRESFRTIYLSFEEKQISALIDTYFMDPKPIIWGDCFPRESSRSIHDQIEDAFPKLIEVRRRAYQELAEFTVPFELHRGCRSAQELLSKVGL